MKACWNAILEETVRASCSQVPNRLRRVVKAKWGYIEKLNIYSISQVFSGFLRFSCKIFSSSLACLLSYLNKHLSTFGLITLYIRGISLWSTTLDCTCDIVGSAKKKTPSRDLIRTPSFSMYNFPFGHLKDVFLVPTSSIALRIVLRTFSGSSALLLYN